ncbi:MAG: hypothetical protein NVS9B9_15070 [Ktedonobacteraceae bacterium]
MQVIFAGGASGVGASCLAIELADQWIVVDAGVRVDRKSDPLPDLALLEGKDVRAIFVTHAHADHIGALPLIHQAFPNAPIFASRATGLLMEVMLADALKIMTRRAVEEMELPLFPQEMVGSMLNMVRPLPVGESLTLAELPGVTIHASRAGHIAGAVSLAFKAPDGSLVVSGDISITPQRTVLGAVAPPMKSCDLLVLESTYGARLHPNRQGEEQRLAQAVADGLSRGGHVLIPCFGLGRGQELVLLLQSAQDKGQIPQFPIYVDGLVRRVCSTYLLLPEALTPTLQRQIRKGYAPFTGPNVSFVRDERDRERILAGSPACIVSSSGMLTGGPSVWFAERLVSNPNASILITGYQDEEAPGRKLLDLAEQKKSTLELNGSSFQVQCQVAKYSLSAHADGSELASFAASVHPKQVALVHGDEEARLALRSKLTDTEVLLPMNGSTIAVQHGPTRRSSKTPATEAVLLSKLPIGISNDRTFEWKYVEELWHAVTQVPSLRIVTARELALVWYGKIVQDAQDEEVLEGFTRDIMYVLAEDYEQKYFVRQSALTEAYRVRGQKEETPQDFLTDIIGQIFLLQVSFDSTKPVLCRAIEPVASIRVSLPRSVSSERTRYPLSALLDLLGPVPQDKEELPHGVLLEELVRAARRIRRTLSPHALVRRCQDGASYTLGEMCEMAGVSAQSLEERLAVAKVLHKYPRLFMPKMTFMEGEGTALYCLTPGWQEALLEPEEQTRPDQNGILTIIERFIGSPSDLYRRSVDPETGDVTLAFHFPDVAWLQYKDALEDAAEEAGIVITIAPNAHQGMLAAMARKLLPQGLAMRGAPSLYPEHRTIQLTCVGQVSQEAITQAEERFHEKTGWTLQLVGDIVAKSVTEPEPTTTPSPNEAQPVAAPPQKVATKKRFNQQLALQFAQHEFSNLPGYYKTGADVNNAILIPRFYFPDVAQTRYANLFAQIEAKTGWRVRLYPSVNQEALATTALQVVPEGLVSNTTPSMYLSQRMVSVTCTGASTREEIEAAKQRFEQETGWQLEILLPAQESAISQGEAMAIATSLFSDASDFYHVGVDTARKVLWLHFHFPDAARKRYAQQFLELEAQTGWHVDLHPNAHQKALVEVARRFLPETISIVSKSLHQETKTLRLTCTGSISRAELEAIQEHFADETGWRLDVLVTVKA